MITLGQDLRYAFRQIAKRPGFTAVVVASLALGIGANTMIFSLLNGLMLKSLPYPDADRVMVLWFTPPNQPNQRLGATNRNCEALRLRPTQSFERIGCMVGGTTNLSEESADAQAAEFLMGQEYSAELAQALNVNPILGRWFTTEENERGRGPIMLISHRLWQRRFGGSPDVLGKKVRVTFTQSAGSNIGTIIGVMPDGFEFLNPQSDYWFAFVLPAGAENSPSRRYTVAGRLKPGVTLAQAQAEMNGIAAGLANEFPRTNKDWGIQVQPVREAYLGMFNQSLITLEGVVAFVLLIACANVAGLLLAQGAAQQKELAVRAALGSGRWRLIRQLLTGNLVLAIMGGVAGLAIGWAGLRVLVNSLPPWFPRANELAIDRTVLLFTTVLSLVTGFVFGIVPALQASRPDVMDALRDSTRSATAGRSHQRLRSAFVVLQVALALVLLIGAGLMINSFLRLYAVEPGFDSSNLMSFRVRIQGDQFMRDTGRATVTGSPETEIPEALFLESDRIQERIAGIPGVRSSMLLSANAPLSGGAARMTFSIGGRQASPAEQEAQGAEWYLVSRRYFETLDVAVLQGREFTAQDNRAGQPVVIINSTMAKRFWPNENPIGREIELAFLNDRPRQIVGIVADVRQNLRQENPQPQMYTPFAQLPQFAQKQQIFGLDAVTFVVRSAGDPERLSTALRTAVEEVDRNQPITDMRTIEWYASNQTQLFRQYVLLLAVFGGVALILATIGIYGIMAHSVTQRTGEIGIRVALGARSAQVLRLVLRRGVVLVAIGLMIGIGGSLALTKVLASVLWGVTPTDPMTFTLVIGGLALVALIACYLPARRALKIDPVIALRYE
jgi:putative ABC transport system permease protein